MGIIELVVLSIGLAMDAFAVSICKGLSMPRMKWKNAIIIGLYFGYFQALMPALGYLLGVNFQDRISNIDHWVAFILLAVIGINMIKEAISKDNDVHNDSIKFKDMIVLAIATSIDALAIGITFAFLNVNLILAISLIGVITFIISVLGVKVGNIFGDTYANKAEFAGGIILLLLGLKLLLEHLLASIDREPKRDRPLLVPHQKVINIY